MHFLVVPLPQRKLCAREDCGKPVPGRRPSEVARHRFCSHECYSLAKTASLEPRKCGHCEVTFQPRKEGAQFCGRLCAGRHNGKERMKAVRAAGGKRWDHKIKADVAEAVARKPLPDAIPPASQSEQQRLIAEFLAQRGATRCETRYVAAVEGT